MYSRSRRNYSEAPPFVRHTLSQRQLCRQLLIELRALSLTVSLTLVMCISSGMTLSYKHHDSIYDLNEYSPCCLCGCDVGASSS